MKRKLKIKKKVVVTTLKPKQLQNVTGGKGGTCTNGGGTHPDTCGGGTRTGCYGF